MSDDGFEWCDAFHASAQAAIDDLLERIMTGDNPGEARALLKVLADKYPDDSPHALEALGHYRGMRAALSEDRWLSLEFDNKSVRKERRRKQVLLYNRRLELFEIEVEATRYQKESVMALSQDWSHLRERVGEVLRLMNSRCMLRLAATLYRAGVPGALELCDRAAFQLFRTAYLQP